MKKFANLEEYLLKENRNDFILYFKEIERIINCPLCDSAYAYKEYWNINSKHTITNLIKKCGFTTEVDLVNKRVRFIRIK